MVKNKTKLSKKVKDLAKVFGVTFRIGTTPEEVKIVTKGMKNPPPRGMVGAYFGNGVVFIKKETIYSKEDMNIVALHEIGHSIIDFYPLKASPEIHEIMANAIALGFASMLRLPISPFVLKNFKKYNSRVRGKK